MTAGATALTTASTAAVEIGRAIKASGAIVRVEPNVLLDILTLNQEALLVIATGGVFSTNYQYLTSYRGLIFFAKSGTELEIPQHCEVIKAKKIWIPD